MTIGAFAVSDRKGWGVFDMRDEDGTVHVAPLIGREHDFDDHCWCHPERDKDEPQLVVHNLEN